MMRLGAFYTIFTTKGESRRPGNGRNVLIMRKDAGVGGGSGGASGKGWQWWC